MPEVLTAGEILVEIMRTDLDVPLDTQGLFSGPFPSGAPAIFIDQVACLGHSAGIIGTVGKDEFGEKILTRLDIDGVDISYTGVREEYATAVAFVSYNKKGDRKFLYHIPEAAAGHIAQPEERRLKGAKLFHVMGCSLMVNSEVRELINGVAKTVKGHGGLISFDPNIRIELLKNVPLEEVIELLQLTGENTPDRAVGRLFSGGVTTAVIKKGREGARLVNNEVDITLRPFSIDEVDPTGAGDAFDAGFICGHLEGLEPKECLALANGCGALNASYFGPMEGVFNRNYVDYFIAKRSAH
jgi:sugar/nucleoside kinase (ribokinase family)